MSNPPERLIGYGTLYLYYLVQCLIGDTEINDSLSNSRTITPRRNRVTMKTMTEVNRVAANMARSTPDSD